MAPTKDRQRRAGWFAWPLGGIAVVLGVYALYTTFLVTTLELVLPCGPGSPYVITFAARSGERLEEAHLNVLRATVPKSGILHLVDELPQGRGFYVQWREQCQGDIRPISSGAQWHEEVGTKVDERTLATFDYLCGCPAALSLRSTCASLLEIAATERRDAAKQIE
ncbi:MAG: hypothetical protein OXR73_12140 [Myxococcales bacterium]|nr:hypothetical protein [Myxococcales bacterium]